MLQLLSKADCISNQLEVRFKRGLFSSLPLTIFPYVVIIEFFLMNDNNRYINPFVVSFNKTEILSPKLLVLLPVKIN